MNERRESLVIGLSGASGAPYAVRLVRRAAAAGLPMDIVVSEPASQVLRMEMNLGAEPREWLGESLADRSELITLHSQKKIGARIASGSFVTRGMVVIPCSMGTLGRIAGGMSSSLIERSADVHLKERRPTVLVVRETPLSLIHLKNMVSVTEAGAIVLPASPGFYGMPKNIDALLDFVVDRVFQALGIETERTVTWTGEPSEVN